MDGYLADDISHSGKDMRCIRYRMGQARGLMLSFGQVERMVGRTKVPLFDTRKDRGFACIAFQE